MIGFSWWGVFTQFPAAPPAQPLRPEARYLTGGPISDGRLLDHQDGEITFWARGHDKKSGNQREPYTLRGAEFTHRWTMHILPKGFVKSRCFGGFSCRQRGTYLDCCRTFLEAAQTVASQPVAAAAGPVEASSSKRLCPRCQTPMECVSRDERVSWREVFNGPHRPSWYDLFKGAILWNGVLWYRDPPDG